MSYGKVAISRRVMVNLTNGDAIEGVLWDERKPLLVLRSASLHTNNQHAPLDGEVVIHADRILFVQVVN